MMQKIKFLLWGPLCLIVLLSRPALPQEDIPPETVFKYPVEIPRVDAETQRFIDTLPPDSAVAVWVFFKDKGVESPAQYRRALDEFAGRLSQRSLRRRMLRGGMPGLDFTDLPVREEYLNQLKSLNMKIRVVSRWLNAVSAEANRDQIEELKYLPFVRSVKKVTTFKRREPLREEKPLKKPAKPPGNQAIDYGNSYGQLAQIHVPELHNIGLSGEGVLITILDTGFSMDHPAFEHIVTSGRLIATHDFINGDDDVDDGDESQTSHGTSVLSAAGGFVDGTIAGSAFGAQFALAKTEIKGEEIQIEEDHWVAGLEWGEALGTDIVSSSLGYTDWYTYQDMDGNTALCTQAADLAASKGVVVVNAQGNERGLPWHHMIAPADGDSVIAVGAVDAAGQISGFSSAGPTYDGRIKPDVVARGVGTYCAVPGGGYGSLGGTSFATPLVAGVCALLLEAHPSWDPIDVREALWTTASKADDPDNLMGYGIVNAAKASGFNYLVVSPQEMNFEASFGDTQIQRTTLSISNWQGGGLAWIATSHADWITLFPDAGFTDDLIWVSVNPSHLRAGINQDSIMLSADAAINSPVKVPVALTLHPGVQVLTYPSPFADSLTVIVEEPDPLSRIRMAVFTVAGELVYRFPENQIKETWQQTWDGRNEKGQEVANGIYLLQVEIGDQSKIVKVAKTR
jgi:subtilisin family serine protease